MTKDNKDDLEEKKRNSSNDDTLELDEVSTEGTISEHQVQLEKLQKVAEDWKYKYQLACADEDNLRKRFKKEKEDIQNFAITKFASEIVNVLDIFNTALSTVNKDDVSDDLFKSFIEGIEMTSRELLTTLDRFNIKEIITKDQMLDPNLHEVVTFQPDESKEDNMIIAELSKGYTIGSRVLKVAKVCVVKNS